MRYSKLDFYLASPQSSASYCWSTESNNNAASQLSTVVSCPNIGDRCYSRYDYVIGDTNPWVAFFSLMILSAVCDS